MPGLVEIDPDAVRGVCRDVEDTRDALERELGPLRARAAALGVPLRALDDSLGIAADLTGAVIPVVREHLHRAEDLASRHHRGRFGQSITAADRVGPGSTFPGSAAGATAGSADFTVAEGAGGRSVLSWPGAGIEQAGAEEEERGRSRSLGDWFTDRLSDAEGFAEDFAEGLAQDIDEAVRAGGSWLQDQAEQTWQGLDAAVTAGVRSAFEAWNGLSGEAGQWIDENLSGVREWIGRHVAGLRLAATVTEVAGWVLIGGGLLLTAVLGAVGAVVGNVPGLAAGMRIGVFAMQGGALVLSASDVLTALADWGEGTIDGQELVNRFATEVVLSVASLIGVGVGLKVAHKILKRLPEQLWKPVFLLLWEKFHFPRLAASVARREEFLKSDDLGDGEQGWVRDPGDQQRSVDEDYGRPREEWSPYPPPRQGQTWDDFDLGDGIAGLDPDLGNVWGTDPFTHQPLTQQEWEQRYVQGNGWGRYPPNDGAVPGTRVKFTGEHGAEAFMDLFGDRLDRIGDPRGEYLGVPPGTSFAERGLPPTSLLKNVHDYRFQGPLPPGWSIEVSKIAPAFGQSGGGQQVLVYNDKREAQSVNDLVRVGVLTETKE